MKTKSAIWITMAILTCCSCQKEWLDKKPDISMVIPTSVTDLQALLDNTFQSFNAGNTDFGEIASDNYYVTDEAYQTLAAETKNVYIWSKDIYNANSGSDWNTPYIQVYYANVVIDGINKLNKSDEDVTGYDNVLGSALFYRSFAFFDLSQIFAKPYNESTANTDLGIPLQLIPIINQNLSRSTLKQTYNQIIRDLKKAVPLLPVTPKYKTRPSKPAAYALLARIYLSMRDYNKAHNYADSCLALFNSLLDFNTLNSNSTVPIPEFSSEVIFHNQIGTNTLFWSGTGNAIIDSVLYRSYKDNDLRKVIFFKLDNKGQPLLSGRFSGNTYVLFDGLATDEVYLIKAETAARSGKIKEAMDALNTLMITRWKAGTFENFMASTAEDGLKTVLEERRKELCFRGLRWSDLRRFNKEASTAVTLTRIIGGQTYTLSPNSDRYVFPIPPAETNYNKNIIQNP